MKEKAIYIILILPVFFMCSYFAHAERIVPSSKASDSYYFVSQSSSAKAALNYAKSYIYGVTKLCTCTHENILKSIVFKHLYIVRYYQDLCITRMSHVSYSHLNSCYILSGRDIKDYYIYSIQQIII